MPGLTEEEKEEGRKAKEALEVEAGGDGEDGEGGDYKGKSQFFTHLKKSEVRHPSLAMAAAQCWHSLALQFLLGGLRALHPCYYEIHCLYVCSGAQLSHCNTSMERVPMVMREAVCRLPVTLPGTRQYRSSGAFCQCMAAAMSCCR